MSTIYPLPHHHLLVEVLYSQTELQQVDPPGPLQVLQVYLCTGMMSWRLHLEEGVEQPSVLQYGREVHVEGGGLGLEAGVLEPGEGRVGGSGETKIRHVLLCGGT